MVYLAARVGMYYLLQVSRASGFESQSHTIFIMISLMFGIIYSKCVEDCATYHFCFHLDTLNAIG